MTDINKFLIPGAVVLAGLFIAGAVAWNGGHPTGAGTTPSGTGGTTAVDASKVNTSGEPYIGQANAPVTLIEWSDYQCPFCKSFEQTTLPQIIQTYVDTGKVKVVFKDFPFLGNDSITASEYARAVWKLYPSQYFAWRTAMFSAQDQEGDTGFGNATSIDALNATISGINAAKISADVAANKAAYDAAANADKSEAGTFGINATPSFVVGTQLIAGAYPYATFDTAIQAALK